MSLIRRIAGASWLVLLAATLTMGQSSQPVATTQPSVDSAVIVERFIEHVKNAPGMEPSARSAILQMWSQRKGDDDPAALMTSSMAVLSKPYKDAMDSVDAGRFEEAATSLAPLSQSDDAYLSAHAAALRARALVEEDRTEDAQKILETITTPAKEAAAGELAASSFALERTFLGPEALFLLGYCRLSNLEYTQAMAAMLQFQELYPEAPEQYRLPVRQMLQELVRRQPQGLGDVSDLMAYAQRQLKHARADDSVQQRQEQAVQLLTQLIEDTEKQEQQQQQQQQQSSGKCKECGGKGCSKCKNTNPTGNKASQKPAEKSTLPGGQSNIGELHPSGRARPGEQWGKMRPEDRERVLQAVRQNFPSRYRQLVEQYYRQLAKEQ